MNEDSVSSLLDDVLDDANVDVAPDGARAFVYLGRDETWVVDFFTGERVNLDVSEDYAVCCPMWWAARPDVALVQAQAGSEMLGRGFQSILAAVALDGTNLRLLGSEPTAMGPFAPAPDGQTVAYDQTGAPWLYRWEIGAEPFDVASYDFPELADALFSHPAWSPSGRRLAWVVGGYLEGEWQGGVGIFNLEQGTADFLYPFEVEGFDGGRSVISWSPDETRLVLDNFGKDKLWILAVDGTELYHQQSASDPIWSLDGQWLAYTRYDAQSKSRQVWVIAADTMQARKLGNGRNLVWSPDGRWLIYDDWLVEVGAWEPKRLDLPDHATVLAWFAK